jgi:hypothetical protein
VPGSAEHRAATLALDELDARVKKLRPADDPRPVVAQIERVLATTCFRMSEVDSPDLSTADSGHALAHWWNEAGGRWWMAHHLELLASRTATSAPSRVQAPTLRRTLSPETRPGHPLASLLCPVAAAGRGGPCGRQTRGWEQRAERYFELFDRKRSAPGRPASCEAKAVAEPTPFRYQVWQECIRTTAHKQMRLPVGHMRAPTAGWLLLRGRRGHYVFCDEVRAYDLATGSVYGARSCSGLALTRGGGVDQRRTDRARRSRRLAGRVPLERLREAVWMTLLAGEAQPDVVEATGHAIPREIEPRLPPRRSISIGGFSVSVSSNQTQLAWTYVVGGRAVTSGSLTWPEDYNNAARDHAVRLWQIAEAAYVQGCPPARLPATLPVGSARPGVSAVDASPAAVAAQQRALLRALGEARRQACGAR